MNVYIQETDSKSVIPIRSAKYGPMTDDETGSSGIKRLFNNNNRITEKIREALCGVDNPEVAEMGREILLTIQETLDLFSKYGIVINDLPPFRPSVFDDGSIVFEWIFKDFRVGLSIEPDLNESGWYLVSNSNLGDINASGCISSSNLKKIIIWLFSYVASNV